LPSFLYASSIMANDVQHAGFRKCPLRVGDSVREPAYGALRLRKTAKSETTLDYGRLFRF